MKKLAKLSLAVIGMTAMIACSNNSGSEEHKTETEAPTQEATTPATTDSTTTPTHDSTQSHSSDDGHGH